MKSLNQFDLNLLKAFDVLMEECHVTRAAERLSLTQSAMSGTLARLRESFDDPLFIRAQRGIIPTERALALKDPVKAALALVNGLLHPPAFEPAHAELTLKIAATDYAMRAVIVPLLAELAICAPNISIALLPMSPDMPQLLAQGQLDFALATPHEASGDLHIKALYEEHYVCVMHADHPLAQNDSLSLAQFCAAEHALVSYYGGSFSGITDSVLTRMGLSRTVRLSVNNFLVLPEILKRMPLIATIPSRLAAAYPDLKQFTPPVPIPGFTKALVWHERTHHDPARQWIRKLIEKICTI